MGQGRKKKGAVPPPLLIQDAKTTLVRLQERVSALLLCSRAPSPPTPTRCPSSLPNWTGAALLWQKSSLLDGDSTSQSDFYAADLKQFFTSLETVRTDAAPSTTSNKPELFDQPVSEGTPVSGPKAFVLPSCSQIPSFSSASSTLGAWQLSVGSQALRDLMELAEDGMTLTQYGYTSKESLLSDIIQEESEDQAKLGVNGFLPETHKLSDEPHRWRDRLTNQAEADPERDSQGSAALSSLMSDLSSMVNNPQLSDVQLQVDSGEVFFAHSFMVYARCPLLAEMVHESGIGVKEEDMPRAQRVLLSDVPGQAVFALLQFLYTAHCSIPISLQPHMLELASRFDLQELERHCHLQQEKAKDVGGEVLDMNQKETANNQTDQTFMELLQSMWNGEDDDATGSDGGEGRQMEEAQRPDEVTSSGDRELCEEQVNEEELEEIYEFAATQKKKKEQDREEEEEDEKTDEEQSGGAVFTTLTEPKEGFGDKPDTDLDCNYSRLFSESWEGDNSSLTSKPGLPKAHPLQSKHQSPQKPTSKQSSRTLLQSSESLVDDLSVNPPHIMCNLPVPGLSPGQERVPEDDKSKRQYYFKSGVPAKQQSQVPHNSSISPPDLSKQQEPEVIVLSDSSEEMDINAAVLEPCRLLADSFSTQNLQTYTEIKCRQDPTPSENKEPSNFESIPNDPLDCSPEISWLIPSTPIQSDRSMWSSSTQTKSSMCRTQLFPKGESSPPSSSLFSSPALTCNNKPQTLSKPYNIPVCATESSVSRLKANRSPLSSSGLKASHKKSCDVRKNRNISVNSSQLPSRYSISTFSKQDAPSQLQHQPYSSTPLHTDLHQPPVLHSASPLHTDKQYSSQQRERALSDNMEETDFGSLHLSPSDPSDTPSSSSHSGDQQSKRQRKSSSPSYCCVESSSGESTQDDLKIKDCVNEEADVDEISFQQSFMDEPPIAFNDSWVLDAHTETNAENNPGCFSLRLEDSGGSNLQKSSSKQQETTRSSSSSISSSTPIDRVQNNRGGSTASPPPQCYIPQPSKNLHFSPLEPNTRTTIQGGNDVRDSKIGDTLVEDEEGLSLPLSQRVSAQLKTPVALQNKKRRSVVPITPMPHYSDMDTPELKNKLGRFGVRALPKRQMVLKLKEIHQYTHQLASSDSEDEAPQKKPPSSQLVLCAQMAPFKESKAPAVLSPVKNNQEKGELLSASQESQGNSSSTAASEESDRSNPELVHSSEGDSDNDGSISSSQVAARLQDRFQAVRSFILSDSTLYSQILQYQPLVLSQFQAQLKAAGVRLGAAKLMDYLDSQSITFTTAKPGHSAPSKGWRGRKTSKRAQKGIGKNNAV